MTDYIYTAEIIRKVITPQQSICLLIWRHGLSFDPKGVAYLEGRGIPAHIQMEAWRSGMLRFLPSDPHEATAWLRINVGEERLREAGLWKNGEDMPEIANTPVVFLHESRMSAIFGAIGKPVPGDVDRLYTIWPWGSQQRRTDA